MHRAAAGDVLQLLRHLVGIVGQRIHLLARERAAKRALPIGRRLLGVAADGNRILEVLQRQHDHVLVLARADADVLQHAGLKPRELGLRSVAARLQPGNRRDTQVGGWSRRDRRGLRGVLESGHGDRRGRNHGAGLIDDGEEQRAVAGGLASARTQRRISHEDTKTRNQSCFAVFVALCFVAIRLSFPYLELLRVDLRIDLEASNVVSSTVSDPTARRSRNGSFSPIRRDSRRRTGATPAVRGSGAPGVTGGTAASALRSGWLNPRHQYRQVRVGIDEQPRGKIVGSRNREHVGLPLGRLRFGDIAEGQRVAAERGGEHAECEPDEILFDRGEPRDSCRVRLTGRGGPPSRAGPAPRCGVTSGN